MYLTCDINIGSINSVQLNVLKLMINIGSYMIHMNIKFNFYVIVGAWNTNELKGL